MTDAFAALFGIQAIFCGALLFLSSAVLIGDKDDYHGKKLFKWSLLGLVTSPLAIIIWPVAALFGLFVAGKRAFS